jgi:hypothetical protein
MKRDTILVRALLEKENHQERDDGRARVDDQPPVFRKPEERPGHEPDHDGNDGDVKATGEPLPIGSRRSRMLRMRG